MAIPLKQFSEKGDDWVELMLPIFTASEANGGVKKSYICNGKKKYKAEHWSEKYSRRKRQKTTVFLFLNPLKSTIKLPCHITLTRYAPRKLDKFDNLPMSLKYILDTICQVITGDNVPGRADSHEGFSVSYEQISHNDYYVNIHIKNI